EVGVVAVGSLLAPAPRLLRPGAGGLVQVRVHVAELRPVGAHHDQVQILLMGRRVLRHRLPVLIEDPEAQRAGIIGARGGRDGGEDVAGSAGRDAVHRVLLVLLLRVAVTLAVGVRVAALGPGGHDAVGDGDAGEPEGCAERHHQPSAVGREPDWCLHQPRTAVEPASSTAARTFASSTSSEAETTSLPVCALTWMSVTPEISLTSSRTDISQCPQVMPVTWYSFAAIG